MARREDELDFDAITQIYKSEKNSQKLLSLSPRFYHLVKEYMDALNGEASKAEDDEPDSSKVKMLRDEIKKSERRIKQIRELRERKISLLAVLKANGGGAKELDLTPEEEALFKDLVKVVRSHKDILGKAKVEPIGEKASEVREEVKREPPTVKEESPSTMGEPTAIETEGQQTIENVARKLSKYHVVQILEDVPRFVGEDATYALSKEDIVTLPVNISELLCKRGKAIEVKIG